MSRRSRDHSRRVASFLTLGTHIMLAHCRVIVPPNAGTVLGYFESLYKSQPTDLGQVPRSSRMAT
jgi:hypothetical protein